MRRDRSGIVVGDGDPVVAAARPRRPRRTSGTPRSGRGGRRRGGGRSRGPRRRGPPRSPRASARTSSDVIVPGRSRRPGVPGCRRRRGAASWRRGDRRPAPAVRRRGPEGDDVAVGELVRLTQPAVWQVCRRSARSARSRTSSRRRTCGPSSALARYRGEAPVRVWLLSIARRVCADHVRRRQRRRRLAERLARPAPAPAVAAPEVVDDLLDGSTPIAGRRSCSPSCRLSYEEAAGGRRVPDRHDPLRVARARADLLEVVARATPVTRSSRAAPGAARIGARPVAGAGARRRPRRRPPSQRRPRGGDRRRHGRTAVAVVVGGGRGRRAETRRHWWCRRRRRRGRRGRGRGRGWRGRGRGPPWWSSPARPSTGSPAGLSTSTIATSWSRPGRVERHVVDRGGRPRACRQDEHAGRRELVGRVAADPGELLPSAHTWMAGNVSSVPGVSGAVNSTGNAPSWSAGSRPPVHSSTVLPAPSGVAVAVQPSTSRRRRQGTGPGCGPRRWATRRSRVSASA